ncbi:hypothetical protein BGZ60DRAFT_471771 [Tricladium varicosporioides]|nr:hypothetical protein BGZ60DRAFT_471771 [Hymenoscyphus varicosporioides]
MVRHGRLSKGCQTCRKRKIKCDQGRPSCSQCIQGEWECPGYGDAIDRAFQNQSVEDFSKSQRAKQSKPSTKATPPVAWGKMLIPRGSSGSSNGSSFAASDSGTPSPHPKLSPVLNQPIKDRSISLFLSSHVLRDSAAVRGYFEYLSDFSIERRNNDLLYTCISAAALAAYANTVQSSPLLQDARLHLGHALRLVNAALASKDATKDTTVISIMLLSNFETLTCQNQKSLMDCDNHLNGAATIIRLRGKEQLKSKIGLQLFLQMCWNILLNCLQRSIRPPPYIVDLRVHAAQYADIEDPAWKLNNVVLKLVEFRASVKEESLSKRDEVIAEALEIDEDFLSVASNMPTEYKPAVFLSEGNTELAYERYYHVYSDIWMANVWNNLRACRLLLHEEINKQIENDSSRSTTFAEAKQHELSMQALHQMTFDICATVPQYSGYLPVLTGGRGSVEPPAAAGIYFLLWPLFNAGKLAGSDSQRAWIIGRLRYIGKAAGIHQAFHLADVLEKEKKIEAWAAWKIGNE